MLIFFDCVLTPQTLVQSSSLSYMGQTADTIFDFEDTLTLIAAFISTGIGLTVLTPLGRIGKSIWFMHWASGQVMSHITYSFQFRHRTLSGCICLHYLCSSFWLQFLSGCITMLSLRWVAELFISPTSSFRLYSSHCSTHMGKSALVCFIMWSQVFNMKFRWFGYLVCLYLTALANYMYSYICYVYLYPSS